MRLLTARRRLGPAVAALAALGAIAPFTPASADPPNPDHGVLAATGWVTLPSFPSGGEAGPVTAKFCVNGATGATPPPPIWVYADGVANPNQPPGPTTVCVGAGAGPSLTAVFTYDEPCPAPVLGFAEGSLNLGAAAVFVPPTPNPNGYNATPPGTEYFAWIRSGPTALLFIRDTPWPAADPQGLAYATADGAGAAVFVPFPGLANVPCPGGPINAYVAAVGAWH